MEMPLLPPARAVAATAPLLGRRYLLSALGEGTGPDPDPRFRLVGRLKGREDKVVDRGQNRVRCRLER